MKKKRIINSLGAFALLLVLFCSIAVCVVFSTDLVLGATIYSDFSSFGGTVNAASYCQLADITEARVGNDNVIVRIKDGSLIVPKDYKFVTQNDNGKYVNHGNVWKPDRNFRYLIVNEKGQWAWGPVVNDTKSVKFRVFERNNRVATATRFTVRDRAYWKGKAELICKNAHAETDREKVEAVYTYLAETMAYDYDSAQGLLITSRELDDRKALESRRGICVNFAHCTANLLNAVGVKTECIRGIASAKVDQTKQSEDHIWNRALVDGRWYQVDTTYAAVFGYSHGEFRIEDGMDSHVVNAQYEPVKDGHANMQWCMNDGLINGLHLANTWGHK